MSRCQVIEIKPDSRENIIKHLIDLDIPNEAAAIISYLSNDLDEAKIYMMNVLNICRYKLKILLKICILKEII